MEPDYLREDLKAEVILILLETSDEKIQNLNANGQLAYYAVRIIINQIQSNTSPFAKIYRQMIASIDNEVFADQKTEYIKNNPINEAGETLMDRESRENMEDRINELAIDEINKLYWYDRDMVLAYKKHGSFREIEKHTGIPFSSCYHTIKKAMNTIKKNVNSNNNNIPGC